ncbi:MAG: FtsX-like permease family protein, partial [Anaerolineae bacterium]|nr:FtsX-like permease family protein [Anaerolineae bacterium]
MFKTRLRKIFRDIASRKGRTALVSISIFIGVLGVVTLTSVSEIMMDKLRSDLKENEIAMFSAWVALKDDATNETIDFDTLQNYPGVTDVEGRIMGRIFWQEAGDDSFIESNLRAFSRPLNALQIEPMRLIEGSYPAEGQNQVVIERRMGERYDLKVGDQITVRILSGLDATSLLHSAAAIENIPEETYTISGIVFHPYTFIGASSIYATPADTAHISGVDSYGRLDARFDNFRAAEAAESGFENWIETNTAYEVNLVELQNPAKSPYISEMEQWSGTLTTLAVVAMLVASFLVVTVINTILVEQRQQIGVMKSLGATQPDNFKIYSGVALTYGLIGTIPGVLLGVPAGNLLILALAPLVGIVVESFEIAPTAIGIGILMGLGVPVLASTLPVYLGTRVSILSAMTDLGLSSGYGKSMAARFITRLPFSPAVRQALANIYQKKGRLALTGATLTLAVGAFMGVTAVFIAMNSVIGIIHDTFNFTIAVDMDEEQDFDALSSLITRNVDEIATVNPSHDSILTILTVPPESLDLNDNEEVSKNSKTLFVDGFDMTGSTLQLDLIEGEAWTNDPDRQGVVLSKKTADELGKKTGDTLTAVQDGQPYPIEVLGITDLPFNELFGFMRWQDVAAIRNGGEVDQPRSLLIQLHDQDISAAENDKIIGELRELLLKNGITANFDNQIAFQEDDNKTILTVGLLFNIASLVMASIGAIGLLVSLSISVFERQREIGVMRSVGANTTTIITQFLTEGLLVGVIAWLIGIPLSYGISMIFKEALPIDFGFSYPPVCLLLGLVGMLVIAFVASIWPSLTASRKTVSD